MYERLGSGSLPMCVPTCLTACSSTHWRPHIPQPRGRGLWPAPLRRPHVPQPRLREGKACSHFHPVPAVGHCEMVNGSGGGVILTQSGLGCSRLPVSQGGVFGLALSR